MQHHASADARLDCNGTKTISADRRLEATFAGIIVAQGRWSLHNHPLQMSEAGGGKSPCLQLPTEDTIDGAAAGAALMKRRGPRVCPWQRITRSTSGPRINPHDRKGRFEADENTTQTGACGAGQREIELLLL